MTRLGRGVLFLALGAVAVRLVLTGGFAWFVQQRMRLPLFLAGAVILGLAVADLVFDSRRAAREEHATDGRIAEATPTGRRSIAPRVGWLLALPLMVLTAVAPTGLGASAANRVEPYVPTQGPDRFDTIVSPTGEAVSMRVYDFLERAILDDTASLADVDVQLEGIVVNSARATDGFILTRFMVSCCAADGVPLEVRVRGVTTRYEDDTWVRAMVRWRRPEVPYSEQEWPWTVEADLVRLEVMKAPGDPYETPY